MLRKLQRRTLSIPRLLSYALTLFVGISVVLLVLQFYFDIKPLLSEQSDVFKSQFAVVNKQISVFKTINKDKIYFTEKEIADLKAQDFVEAVSFFRSAGFKIKGRTRANDKHMPLFQSDLFFESIPNEYLDVQSDVWNWTIGSDFLPIIIPENYLKLYNFGFAESQGLPVVSKHVIERLTFEVEIQGAGGSAHYKSRIVGFSNRINSILVPDAFLQWANEVYGDGKATKPSRLLLAFKDPTDERILNYFESRHYSINEDSLALSRLNFMFNAALLFVFSIALIVVILSISFIFMSIHLILEKNRELLRNLYLIAYSNQHIGRFYQFVISGLTFFVIVLAVALSLYMRKVYLAKMQRIFEFEPAENYILLGGVVSVVFIVGLYVWSLKKNIDTIVKS